MKDCRAVAATIVSAVMTQQHSLTGLLAHNEKQVRSEDRGLLAELCYGSLRYHDRLLCSTDKLLQAPLRERDADVLALILIGMYQLDYTRIPDHAAISTVVEACRSIGKTWATKLVNGVLRNYQRRKTTLEAELQDDPGFRYSHPDWLIRRITQAWPEQAETIFAANNQPASMTLRVNLQRHSRIAYSELLQEKQVGHQLSTLADTAIILDKSLDVGALPGFQEGWCSVQDEAAQLAAPLLDIAPGMRVLDACAAPGGKTGHILEQQPTASVIAIDNDVTRLQRVQDNLSRLQLPAQLVTADLTRNDWWDGKCFDRILLDAPCSATGVIRRHPDIKLLRRDEDIAVLARQQLLLLEQLWDMLAPGGKLLYATCSILPDENEQVVGQFLQQKADASTIRIAGNWGIGVDHGCQLLPGTGSHDGFYYALMTKAL